MTGDVAETKKSPVRTHSLVIEERRRALLSGITDVLSFNEQEIVMLTEEGDIQLVGDSLHIAMLSLEDGHMTVEGKILAIEYGDKAPQRKGGLVRRLFS